MQTTTLRVTKTQQFVCEMDLEGDSTPTTLGLETLDAFENGDALFDEGSLTEDNETVNFDDPTFKVEYLNDAKQWVAVKDIRKGMSISDIDPEKH